MNSLTKIVVQRLLKEIVAVGTGDLLLRVLFNLELSDADVRDFHVDRWASELKKRLKGQLERLRLVQFPPATERFFREADLCYELLNTDNTLSEDEAIALLHLFESAEALHNVMHGPEYPLGFRHPLHVDVHICCALAEVGLNRREEDAVAEKLLSVLDGHCSRGELCALGWDYYFSMGFSLSNNEPYLPMS